MTEDPPRQRRTTLMQIGSGEHEAVGRHENTIPRFTLGPNQTGVTAKPPARNLFPTRTFHAGAVLAQAGERLPLYIIRDGLVQVTGKSLEGKSVTMPPLESRDVIGGESYDGSEQLTAAFTYTAVDTVTVYDVDMPHLKEGMSIEQHTEFEASLRRVIATHVMTSQDLVERVVELKARIETHLAERAELQETNVLLDMENADLKRRLTDLECKVDENNLRMGAIETRQKASDAENGRLKAKLAEQAAKQAELDQTLKNIGELLIGGDTLAEAMVNQGGFKGAMGLRAQNLLHALRARAGDARTIPFDDLNSQVDRLSD